MCKEIFMTERMDYLQTVRGYTVTRAYNEALKEWEAQKGNSSNAYEEPHDDRDEEEHNA